MREGQNVPKDYIREKKVKCRFFPPLVQRRILFPPPPPTFLTSLPPPSLFLSFLPPLPSSGIFQPGLAWAKSTKKAFSEAARRCTRAICLFWDAGQEILPGLSHGGSFKETSVFSCRPSPLRARPPLPVGGDAGRADQGPARVPAPAPPQKEGRGAEKERVLPADRTG